MSAHAKTPLEFLYLESGAIPIRFLISSRRMIYLQHILKRKEGELVKKVYEAQAENPTKGDFVELLKDDFDKIQETQDNNAIVSTSAESYKKYIKTKIRSAALRFLTEKKEKHSKIKSIQYNKLETQGYLTSPLFTNSEVQLLFSLRSRMADCKENFKNKYKESDLLCPFCSKETDSQPHMMECTFLASQLKSKNISSRKIVYEDIFDDIKKQKEATEMFKDLIGLRDKFKEEHQFSQLDPCTSAEVLRNSDDLLSCIDNYSSGK